MTTRPILFSGPMVRAILAGTKTQTRRILKPQPDFPPNPRGGIGFSALTPARHYEMRGWTEEQGPLMRHRPLPFWRGDVLWVRETWAVSSVYDGIAPRNINPSGAPNWCGIRYAATDEPVGIRNRVSIHMPRWASRITLKVTNVRVERLQDISEADAIAEGVEAVESERDDHDWSICPKCGGTGLHGALGDGLGYMEVDCQECNTHKKRYSHLWNHINGDGAWEANPFVVAVTFTVHKCNVDAFVKSEAA